MSLRPAPLTHCLEDHLREKELETQKQEKDSFGLPRLSIDSDL